MPLTEQFATLAVRSDAEVGEGPVWDRRSGRLVWVDLTRGRLFETDLETGTQKSSSVDAMIGAAVPRTRRDGFAVAASDGFGFIVEGKLEIVDPVLPEPHRRMNDAKCDSKGRLWAGSNHMEFEAGKGKLHCWEGGAPSRVVTDGLTLPNGLGWSADDTVMYLADSMSHQLLSAPFDRDQGLVGQFTELCRIETGLPDGLAIDVEGCIWLAIWGAGEVQRFDSMGRLIGRVRVPVDQPSSCAFGDDGTLYITSASYGLDESQRRAQPLAGSIFAVSTDTNGVPVHAFEG